MTDVERLIAETVEQVARSFARAGFVHAGALASPDDLAQEGFLVALEALGGFDPSRGTLPGYLQAVLRPSLGKAVARWFDPCSLSEYRARRVGRHERDFAAYSELIDDERPSPEDELAAAESRARAALAVSEVLAEMGKRAAELVAMDPDATSDEVAARAGVSGRRVRTVREAFRERVIASPRLREIARAVA